WPDWVRSKDFRYAAAILSEVHADDLQQQYDGALRRARGVLGKEHAELSETVEQALMDGAIAEEHSEFTAILQSIEPEHLLNLRPAGDELRTLRASLAAARTARLSHLEEKWSHLQPLIRNRRELHDEEANSLCAF